MWSDLTFTYIVWLNRFYYSCLTLHWDCDTHIYCHLLKIVISVWMV